MDSPEQQQQGFNFSNFVEDLVLQAISSSEKIKDALTDQAEEAVVGLTYSAIEGMDLPKKEDVKNITDQLVMVEEDLDQFEISIEEHQEDIVLLRTDVDEVSNDLKLIEKNYITTSEFNDLTEKIEQVEILIKKYQPFLEMLSLLSPFLKKIGVLKPINNVSKVKYCYYQPLHINGNWST